MRPYWTNLEVSAIAFYRKIDIVKTKSLPFKKISLDEILIVDS